MKNLRWLLSQHGCDAKALVPCVNISGIFQPIKKFISQVLPLNCWGLQFVFRVLFPTHPLVDQNHSAAPDTIQLALITQLAFELSKPPQQRNLPANLLQGLENLPSLSTETVQANTLDNYFKRVEDVGNIDIQGLEEVSKQETGEKMLAALNDALVSSGGNDYRLIDSLDAQDYDESAESKASVPLDEAEFMLDEAGFSLEDLELPAASIGGKKRKPEDSPFSQDSTNPRKKGKFSRGGQ